MKSQMQSLFKFEQDFGDSLRCIPMAVRFKLDTSGIKLKLSHWLNLSHTQRNELLELPCAAKDEIQAYRSLVHQFTAKNLPTDLPIDPEPNWLNIAELPEALIQKLAEVQREISLKEWQNLSAFQRFTLIKLSRSSHENLNFIPALEEFGITD